MTLIFEKLAHYHGVYRFVLKTMHAKRESLPFKIFIHEAVLLPYLSDFFSFFLNLVLTRNYLVQMRKYLVLTRKLFSF